MDREEKDITCLKTYILLCNLILYFMTNPSERTKLSLIPSPPPLLPVPFPLCSTALDLGCDSPSLKFKYNHLQDLKGACCNVTS